ncbi:hypothetical protein EON67_11210 [archaeon]|nr:MAG: hypothetical protein EON67_11210 [archaeon]
MLPALQCRRAQLQRCGARRWEPERRWRRRPGGGAGHGATLLRQHTIVPPPLTLHFFARARVHAGTPAAALCINSGTTLAALRLRGRLREGMLRAASRRAAGALT